MAELLIKVRDNIHRNPNEDRGSYKRGDIVVAMPDGHAWGRCEHRVNRCDGEQHRPAARARDCARVAKQAGVVPSQLDYFAAGVWPKSTVGGLASSFSFSTVKLGLTSKPKSLAVRLLGN